MWYFKPMIEFEVLIIFKDCHEEFFKEILTSLKMKS